MQTRKPYLLILMLGFALLAGVVQAAPLNILGVDDLTCVGWSKSKENPDQRSIYVVWMRGVLTGHNYAMQSQQVSSISSGTIESYVSSYCARNPNGLVSDAVFRLSDDFSGRNQPIRK
jgi:hypothetical protein